jgi:hypothetical protein
MKWPFHDWLIKRRQRKKEYEDLVKECDEIPLGYIDVPEGADIYNDI